MEQGYGEHTEEGQERQKVVCTSVGVYEQALTRGQQYEVLLQDEEGQRVRLRGDNNRARWYPSYLFAPTGTPVPILTSWCFNDLVDDPLNERDVNKNMVDVTVTLSDGTTRWCLLTTPDYLKWLLEERDDPSQWGGEFEPGLCASNLIVMRDLAHETVDWMLRHLDRQGELEQHSIAYEKESSSPHDL